MTYNEALRTIDQPTPTARSFFADLDDAIEKREPGWKAKRAAERSEKVKAWAERKTAIIARFGNLEAAWAPCWRETLILKAVAPWRKVSEQPGPVSSSLEGYAGRMARHGLPVA